MVINAMAWFSVAGPGTGVPPLAPRIKLRRRGGHEYASAILKLPLVSVNTGCVKSADAAEAILLVPKEQS